MGSFQNLPSNSQEAMLSTDPKCKKRKNRCSTLNFVDNVDEDAQLSPNPGTYIRRGEDVDGVDEIDRSILWKKSRQNKNREYDNEDIEEQAAMIVKILQTIVGSLDNIVAHGTMFEKVGPEEPLHTVPLGEANVLVSIDFVIQEDVILPIPILGETYVVGDATGYHVAWPKFLILFGNEPVDLELVLWQISNLGSSRNTCMGGESVAYKEAFTIMLDEEMFGANVEVPLQKVYMEYMSQIKELSVTCIMLYMRFHWVLFVIDLSYPTICFLDSLHGATNPNLKLIIKTAVKIRDNAKNRGGLLIGRKLRSSIVYILMLLLLFEKGKSPKGKGVMQIPS
ncbi:hypothetical protein RHSIM_RhsimUnG0147600 [Rhododendron simsii]|uniref:DUF8039 domain-containing protein n=1 Tax=Rhododendron simsii TaxID=118357 RepID=A0A834FUS6_RHOSS|nr:hypothetical protein RHSIM_RhsimUnG0147600 [Rhododendron simsii]